MKKLTIVLMAFLLSGVVANAQTHFGIRLGGVFPMGDFGEATFRGGDPSRYFIWDEGTEGGTGFGFNLGLHGKFDIPSVKGLGVVFSIDGIYNGLNGDMRDYVEEWEEDTYDSWNELDIDGEVDIALPKYFNLPVMLGVNYSYPVNEGLSVFGEAAVGLNVRMLTNSKRNSDCSYYDDSYGTRIEVNRERVWSYDVATSFAFRLGTGIMIKDKYSIGLDYFALGGAKLKGEYKSERSVSAGGVIEDDSYSEKIRGRKTLSPTMLMLRFGINF